MAMPPEDRQIFQRNAERWMRMGPEERALMRAREKEYRERVKVEVDTALHDSGLHLKVKSGSSLSSVIFRKDAASSTSCGRKPKRNVKSNCRRCGSV
jgi:hypothetical protein